MRVFRSLWHLLAQLRFPCRDAGRAICSRGQGIRHPLPPTVLLVLAVLLGCATAAAADPDREVRIGVLAFRDQWTTLGRWRPTAQYLSDRIPGHRFEFVTYDHRGLRAALSRGDLDFILTNTSHFLELRSAYRLTSLATLVNQHRGQPLTRFGATIFTRADRADIVMLEDLRGRAFVAAGREAFGGFQMAWYRLLGRGIDPFADFTRLQFTGLPQDQVVLAVRDGVFDAGTVRTGVLERMTEDGKIRLDEFKVLDPQADADFPFARSTRLYPEWPLARAAHTPDALAKAVAAALFALDPHSVAARQARIAGWTVPMDVAPVDVLLASLKIGPYASPAGRWPQAVERVLGWLGVGFPAAVLGAAWFHSRSRRRG